LDLWRGFEKRRESEFVRIRENMKLFGLKENKVDL